MVSKVTGWTWRLLVNFRVYTHRHHRPNSVYPPNNHPPSEILNWYARSPVSQSPQGSDYNPLRPLSWPLAFSLWVLGRYSHRIVSNMAHVSGVFSRKIYSSFLCIFRAFYVRLVVTCFLSILFCLFYVSVSAAAYYTERSLLGYWIGSIIHYRRIAFANNSKF